MLYKRNPQLNKNGELIHLLSIEGLPKSILTQVLDTATNFVSVNDREVKKVPLLRGKSVFNLFFENSTRTRTTFEIAAKRLSADVINLDIAPYDHAGYVQHDPKRARKLLLHRRELNKLVGKVSQRGLTLIPLGVHFNNRGWAKVRLGLARGRQMFDKRAAIREREQKRDIARQSRKYGAR